MREAQRDEQSALNVQHNEFELYCDEQREAVLRDWERSARRESELREEERVAAAQAELWQERFMSWCRVLGSYPTWMSAEVRMHASSARILKHCPQ